MSTAAAAEDTEGRQQKYHIAKQSWPLSCVYLLNNHGNMDENGNFGRKMQF